MTRLSSGSGAAAAGVGRGEDEPADGDVVGAGSVGAGVGWEAGGVTTGTVTGVGLVDRRGGSTGMCLGLVNLTVVGGDLAGTVVVVDEGTVVVVDEGTVVVVDEGTVVVVDEGAVVVVDEGTVVVVAEGTVVVVEAGTVVGGVVVVVEAVASLAPAAEETRTATGALTVSTLTVTQRGPTGTAEARLVGRNSATEATSDALRTVTKAKRTGPLPRRRGRSSSSSRKRINGFAAPRRSAPSGPPIPR